ncbi:MAG: glycine cleavage system protein GcvH [Phycisphaerae bacterium]
MPSPSDRHYTESHEWIKTDGDQLIVGVTQFAVNALSDVTYAALPAVGKAFGAGDVFGEVESVKATSELYLPVAGTVTAVNTALVNDPAILNTDPYEAGWLVKIKPNSADLSGLMNAAEYDAKHPV